MGDRVGRPFDLLAVAVRVRTPVRQIDAAGSLTTFHYERLHREVRVDVGTLQVVARRPGVGIVRPVGEKTAIAWGLLRDGELDCLACISIFKVQDQRWVELAWVVEITRHRAMGQILYINIHVKSFICPTVCPEQLA